MRWKLAWEGRLGEMTENEFFAHLGYLESSTEDAEFANKVGEILDLLNNLDNTWNIKIFGQ